MTSTESSHQTIIIKRQVSLTEQLINSTLNSFYYHYRIDPGTGLYILAAKNGALLYDWLMNERVFEIPADVKGKIWSEEKKNYLWQRREGLKPKEMRKQKTQLHKEFECLAKENKIPLELTNYYKTGLIEYHLTKLDKEGIVVTIIWPDRD